MFVDYFVSGVAFGAGCAAVLLPLALLISALLPCRRRTGRSRYKVNLKK